jgi:hypothetical protein
MHMVMGQCPLPKQHWQLAPLVFVWQLWMKVWLCVALASLRQFCFCLNSPQS